MSYRLYDRWLAAGDTQTLSEFVAEYRALQRQARAQQRWARHMGPLMQQTPSFQLLQQQALLQNAPLGMYRGPAPGGLGSLFGLPGRL